MPAHGHPNRPECHGDRLAMLGYVGSSGTCHLAAGQQQCGFLREGLATQAAAAAILLFNGQCGRIVCVHVLYAHMVMLSRNTPCYMEAGVLNTHQEISKL